MIKKILPFICFLTWIFHSQAQSLVTVAGGGSSGNGGDGGSALLAQFGNLTGVAIDKHGNIYISDAAYERVRVVDNTGNIHAYAGTGASGGTGDNGPAINATLNSPSDITLDTAGNLYIADQGNGKIRKVDYSTGIITTVVTGLSAPSGVVLDAIGNMYVTEQDGNIVSKIDTAGNITTIAGTGVYGYSGNNGKATLAEIETPYGICLDAIGNVYFTELGSGVLAKVDTSGIITTVAGDGTEGYNGDGIVATTAKLDQAEGVGLDYQGNVYIADGSNDRVRIVNTAGIINTYIGAGGVINAAISFEAGLVFDPYGNLYIVNNGDYKVQKLGSAIPPVAGFSVSDNSICAGAAVNFNNLSTNAASYSWSFPGGVPDTSTNANPTNIVYTATGAYNVQLIAINSSGRDTLLRTNYITVNPLPDPVISTTDSIFCPYDSTLIQSSVTYSSYLWNNTDTTSSISVNSAGNYWVTIIDANGCSAVSGQQHIDVFPPAIVPLLSTGDSLICSSDSTRITASGVYPSYEWNTGDTGSYIFASTAGGYWVSVTDTNGCSAVSGQQHINIFPLTPVPNLYAPDSLICSSDSAKITTSGVYSLYNWNTGDTGSYIYVSSAGGYWVTVTDTNGCSAVSGHHEISVYPVSSVSIVEQGDTLYSFGAVSYQWYYTDSIIPGATGPMYVAKKSGDYEVQIVDTNGCTALSNGTPVEVAGIGEVAANNGLNIYPDPFTSTIFVENNNTASGILSIQIYDALGRKVLSENTSNPGSGLLQLDVSSLPPGPYYIAIARTCMEEYNRQMIKIAGKN